jgi:mannosyltransferase
LRVVRPSAPAPEAALGMQNKEGATFGPLELLGYDAYKLGTGPQDGAAVRPGDVLHAGLYWRAASQPGANRRVRLALVDSAGQVRATIEGEPASDYPTGLWQAGDVWRGQFSLPIPGDAPPGRYRLRVQVVAPDGSEPGSFVSDPIQVGP